MSDYEDDDFFDDDNESEGASKDKGFDEDFPVAKKASSKKSSKDDDDDDYGGYDDEFEEEKKVKKPAPVVKENRFVRFTGKITPLTRDDKNVVVEVQIQNLDDNKIYPVEMNAIGSQLIKRCFHELYVTGELVPRGDKKFTLVIKSFL